jgi:hypothetical protein
LLRLQRIKHKAKMLNKRNACLDHFKCDYPHVDSGDRGGDNRCSVSKQRDTERKP